MVKRATASGSRPIGVALRAARGIASGCVTLCLVLAGCGGGEKPSGGDNDPAGGEATPGRPRLVEEMPRPVYDDSSAALPRLLYADGTRTLNDRCMVRQSKLDPRIRAIYVNGRPVGFC